MKKRCLFAPVGGLFLLAMNLVRLVSLALVDAHFPQFTAAIHWNVWPAVIIVVVVLLWVWWVRGVRMAGHAFG